MSDIRKVETWRKIFYINSETFELDSDWAKVVKDIAYASVPENFKILGEPKVVVSRPMPEFEFGVDEETGETYRNPDAVIVDFRVVEK